MRFYLVTFASIVLTGCSVTNEQSVYEGVRSQQKAKNAGSEPKQPTLPSYQQYEKELDELKK